MKADAKFQYGCAENATMSLVNVVPFPTGIAQVSSCEKFGGMKSSTPSYHQGKTETVSLSMSVTVTGRNIAEKGSLWFIVRLE